MHYTGRMLPYSACALDAVWAQGSVYLHPGILMYDLEIENCLKKGEKSYIAFEWGYR